MDAYEAGLKDYAILINGFKLAEDGKHVVPQTIKFPKCVYERIKAFDDPQAVLNGWAPYGILMVIMGYCDEYDYGLNPFGDEKMFRPSKEFEQWRKLHRTWGPMLIMRAIVYSNYELEE